ncbi:MAG: DUF362 domain-containing protein, partial [Chloroflexi bacterium]|nr:DUF362 domain-containing protein [Chloroflexota bacterium]
MDTVAGTTRSRGYTFAEKALARAAGLPSAAAGQVVDARPDVALSHDNTAAIARIFRAIGLERVAIPDKICVTLDHAVPAPTARHAQNHAEVRAFVREQGIENFFEVGRGVCHQVFGEEALVLPGQDPSSLTARRSYAARFVTRDVNKLINLPTLKDHQSAGVTLAL